MPSAIWSQTAPQKPFIDAAPDKPIVDYESGKVGIELLKEPSLQIDFTNLDIKV
ncbi:DUF6470 family protein [Metabacillus arenae]|uniref:DUF6470 family protein n=1 Tax=Metabacillus arenae TaxID=2771434 RepID=UPI0037CC32CF